MWRHNGGEAMTKFVFVTVWSALAMALVLVVSPEAAAYQALLSAVAMVAAYVSDRIETRRFWKFER